MPRNDQVTRQWHLLRHLEAAAHGATLQALADALPADFPKHLRTVRRDLEALEGAGFPLLTERVEGRVVWKLMEGFRRIPALAFSPTELMALRRPSPRGGRSSSATSRPPGPPPPGGKWTPTASGTRAAACTSRATAIFGTPSAPPPSRSWRGRSLRAAGVRRQSSVGRRQRGRKHLSDNPA
jgi:hypothetical protein